MVSYSHLCEVVWVGSFTAGLLLRLCSTHHPKASTTMAAVSNKSRIAARYRMAGPPVFDAGIELASMRVPSLTPTCWRWFHAHRVLACVVIVMITPHWF